MALFDGLGDVEVYVEPSISDYSRQVGILFQLQSHALPWTVVFREVFKEEELLSVRLRISFPELPWTMKLSWFIFGGIMLVKLHILTSQFRGVLHQPTISYGWTFSTFLLLMQLMLLLEMDIISSCIDLLSCRVILLFISIKLRTTLLLAFPHSRHCSVTSWNIWASNDVTVISVTREACCCSEFTRNRTASTNVRVLLLLHDAVVFRSTCYASSFELSQNFPFLIELSGTRDHKTCDNHNKDCTDAVLSELNEQIASCNCLERCESLSYEVTIHKYSMLVQLKSMSLNFF